MAGRIHAIGFDLREAFRLKARNAEDAWEVSQPKRRLPPEARPVKADPFILKV